MHRLRALDSVWRAQAELNRLAWATDAPDWQDVEAADLLDAAARLLTKGAQS